MTRNPVDISLPTMSAPENLPVYDVAAGALNLKKDTQYKVSMDVSATEDFSDDLNRSIESAGVKIYLCGQTAAYRGFAVSELNPAVNLALSAITAHVRLQSEGYTLIPF